MKGLPAEEHSALESRLKGALCLEINIQRFTLRFIMTYIPPSFVLTSCSRTVPCVPRLRNAQTRPVHRCHAPFSQTPNKPWRNSLRGNHHTDRKRDQGWDSKNRGGDTLMRHVTQSCGKYCIAANTIDKTPNHAAQILA